MGPILRRYFVRQMLMPFLFGLAAFISILLIVKILKLVELVVSRGVPLTRMLQVFSYILPAFLEVALPMALLLAVILAFARLSADSELTALKSSGISLYQMMLPVAMLAVPVALLTLACSVYLRPWGNLKVKGALYEITKMRATAGLRERVFNDDFDNYVIYVEQIDPPGNVLHGVLIADLAKHETVIAKTGLLIASEARHTIALRLQDGTLHSFTPGKHPYEHKDYQRTRFAQADYTLNLKKLAATFDKYSLKDKDPKEMTLSELRKQIANKRAAGEFAGSTEVELYRRLAIPFACLVFALLGVSLGVHPSRSVRSRSFAISLAVIFFYYLLLSTGETLGSRGLMNPMLAVWLPNLFFGTLGLLLLVRTAHEIPFALPARLTERLRKTRLSLGLAGGSK